MTWWICRTCAVESAERSDVCPICADERQWVPVTGQQWTTMGELGARHHVRTGNDDGVFGLAVSGDFAIPQRAVHLRERE